MGNALPIVAMGNDYAVYYSYPAEAVQCCAGEGHTCSLFRSGRVKCFGDNIHGQLGLGDVEPRGDDYAELGDLLAFVDLGEGVSAASITCGANHTCALLSNGEVKCWGSNSFAQLGVSTELAKAVGIT
eukprot:5772381-Amphidinium_carterae.1